MKPKHYSRKFLNKTEGTAFIEVSAKTIGKWVDADVTIADCSRMVSLDFSFETTSKKERKEKLDKINLLIKELEAMKNFIEDH